MAGRDDIGFAHKIASEIKSAGYDCKSGGTVLAMALGILAASDPRGHRNMRPLVDGHLRAAQLAFDALRENLEKPTQ